MTRWSKGRGPDREARAPRSCEVCGGVNRSPRAVVCAPCRRRLRELEGADPAQLDLFAPVAVRPCACGRKDLISTVEQRRAKCDWCILADTILAGEAAGSC